MKVKTGLGIVLTLIGLPLTAQQAPAGYLAPGALPDSSVFLPPPPAPGTPAHAADRAAYDNAKMGIGGADWKAGIEELYFGSPEMRFRLSCAAGATLDPKATPALNRLLTRAALDVDAASRAAKARYARPRPFEGDAGAVTCDPRAASGGLAKTSPSYPSGHAAAGWLWGLVLSELAPERSTQALRFGAGVGEHRIACRVHYPSDIAAGRMLGAAVYARLQTNEAFQADVTAARAEIAVARKAGAPASCPTP
jgi:acid phosphatase (class A)